MAPSEINKEYLFVCLFVSRVRDVHTSAQGNVNTLCPDENVVNPLALYANYFYHTKKSSALNVPQQIKNETNKNTLLSFTIVWFLK